MKRIISIFLLGMIVAGVVTASAEDDGYKNLKWGMSVEEMKKVYVNVGTGKICGEWNDRYGKEPVHPQTVRDLIYRYDKSFFQNTGVNELIIRYYILNDIAVYTCEKERQERGVAFLTYKEKLFAYVKGFESYQLQEIMPQLQSQYPKGKTSNTKDPIDNKKYTAFEYSSDNTEVFNTSDTVYIVSSKKLKEIFNLYQQGKQTEEQKKKSKSNL